MGPILADDILRLLLEAAVCAPSGDNSQPWRLRPDRMARRLDVLITEDDDRSAMNAGQRMSRLAIGAAVENVVRQARRIGLRADLVAPAAGAVASIVFSGEPVSVEREPLLSQRATNRRLYDRRPVGPETMERLRAETAPFEGVTTRWIVEPKRIEALARVTGRADALFFESKDRLSALLDQIQFDASPTAPVPVGLSIASLELRGFDHVLLRLLVTLPAPVLRALGSYRSVGSRSRRLARSSSGFCVGISEATGPETDIPSGRAMERAWLALTAEGLACQPMMAAVGLGNAIPLDLEADRPIRRRLLELRDEVSRVLPESSGGRVSFLMRFGHAPPPSGRCGRRPLSELLIADSSGRPPEPPREPATLERRIRDRRRPRPMRELQ
jgi:nitroreductase